MEDALEISRMCAAFFNDEPGFKDDDMLEGLGVACTHTHTCSGPVDDPAHTHTCVHVHTKTVGVSVAPPPPDAAAAIGASSSQPPPVNASSSKKKPPPSASGKNRVAVRKYRAKKKAEAASLEEEVARLRAFTQHLQKTNAELQAEKMAWKAEADRLRLLLVDIGGRIQGEIGVTGPCFQQRHNIHTSPVICSCNNIVDLQVPTGGVGVKNNNNHGHGGSLVGHGAGAAVRGTSSTCDFRRCNDQMYYHCNPAGTGSMQQGAFRGHLQVVGVGHGACHGANIQCTAGSSTSSRLPPQPVSVSHGQVVDTGPAAAGGLPNADNTHK